MDLNEMGHAQDAESCEKKHWKDQLDAKGPEREFVGNFL